MDYFIVLYSWWDVWVQYYEVDLVLLLATSSTVMDLFLDMEYQLDPVNDQCRDDGGASTDPDVWNQTFV